jgi:Uma2 family endonuclease
MEVMGVESVPIKNQPLRHLKRVEYDQLVEQGLFRDERVELIFGQVVAMSPIDPSHVESTARLHARLVRALADRAQVRSQAPIAATEDSEPEPDVYVTPLGDYWRDHASRAHLVIEVARSSLAYDRNEKALLYASSQVEEYWIVDLVHGLVEVRRDPDRGVWRSLTTARRGDTIAMLAFPDVTVEVSEILPPVGV